MPTTWADFPAHKVRTLKPILNQDSLNNLKFQHFTAPLGGQQFFGTTHCRDFSSKKVEKVNIDPHKLHRSSLPIGTFNKNNTQLA